MATEVEFRWEDRCEVAAQPWVLPLGLCDEYIDTNPD